MKDDSFWEIVDGVRDGETILTGELKTTEEKQK